MGYSLLFLCFLCTLSVALSASGVVKQNGDTLQLHCTVNEGSVKWLFNEMDVTSFARTVGQGLRHNSTLKHDNVTASNAGLYQCRNGSGGLIDEFDVTVITIVGEDVTVRSNDTSAQLTCLVINKNVSMKSFKWTKMDKDNKVKVLDDINKYNSSRDTQSSTLEIKNINVTNDTGLYECMVVVDVDEDEYNFTYTFGLNTPPAIQQLDKPRGKVEEENVIIECKVSGFPIPTIEWRRKLEDKDDFELIKVEPNGRINLTANRDEVPNATLVITDLKIDEDRGDYKCTATNKEGSASETVQLKVKDKLAAVWPFLGIVAEVAVLCSIIFIFEKRRSRKMEEDEEVDAVKQDLMSHANGGNDEKDIRQRNNTVKS